jgi:hypothetical protein
LTAAPPPVSPPALDHLPPPAPASAPLPGVTASRVAGAVIYGFFLFLLYGYLPYRVDPVLAAHGLAPRFSPELLLAVGALLAFLSAFAYAAKPTRAWGPARLGVYAVVIGYLLVLLRDPFDHVTASSVTFTFGYGPLLELFLIPPALGALYAILVTVGDYLHPQERIRRMFG